MNSFITLLNCPWRSIKVMSVVKAWIKHKIKSSGLVMSTELAYDKVHMKHWWWHRPSAQPYLSPLLFFQWNTIWGNTHNCYQSTHLHADSHLQVRVCDWQASFQPMESLDELGQLCQLGLTASQVWQTQGQKVTVWWLREHIHKKVLPLFLTVFCISIYVCFSHC